MPTMDDILNHQKTQRAKRVAADEKKLTGVASAVVDKVQSIVEAPMPVDDKVTALKAMVDNSASGTPAALPSGTNVNDQQALQVLVASSDPKMTQGKKAAIMRILSDESEPSYMEVDDNGFPKEVVNHQREVINLRTELSDERDKTKPGSLAFQLEEAKARLAAAGSSAPSTLSETSVNHVKSVRDALAHLAPKATSFRGNTFQVTQRLKDDLVQQLDAVIHEIEPAPAPTAPPSSTP